MTGVQTCALPICNFTNNKVLIAKVFNMRSGVMRLTPEAIESHGTHVAGTVACDYGTPAEVEGVTIPHTISGVAPAALLGNYNVFPGTVENARSEDILNALEAAYADGMNIVNMSLGGGFSQSVNDAVARVETNTRQALAAMTQGDTLRTMLAGARRLFKWTPIDTVTDRKSTRLNSSHIPLSRMPSSA